jgi:hypothetical protein
VSLLISLTSFSLRRNASCPISNNPPSRAFWCTKNNQQVRGAALITHLLDLLLYNTRLFRVFSTMITTVLVLVFVPWKFFLAIEAAYTAAKLKKPEAPLPLSRLTYPALAVIFSVAGFFPSLEHITGETDFAAFKSTLRFDVSHDLPR